MTNKEAERDFKKFISMKTSAISRPAFVDPVINAFKALEFVEEIKEFAFNTDDDFCGEVLCRKLAKYGFIRKENDEWVRSDEQ